MGRSVSRDRGGVPTGEGTYPRVDKLEVGRLVALGVLDFANVRVALRSELHWRAHQRQRKDSEVVRARDDSNR